MRIKYQETTFGPCYSATTTSANGVVCPFTIAFPYGLEPKLLGHFGLTTMIAPSRFGKWGTKAQRRAYVRAYAKQLEQATVFTGSCPM